MTLLALRDLACFRGGRLLFEGLNLSLDPGEAAIVTGPNGVGKSSLIRLAAGLLQPAAGSVELGGSVALADDSLALDDKLPLGRALAFWAGLDGGSAESGMAAMGLFHLADVPVRMLSAGQRKRAMLARIASSGASLWLLDEPANGLDAEGLDRLSETVAGHRSGGGALLAATHLPLGIKDTRAVELR